MIYTADNRMDLSALTQAYKKNSIEVQLLEAMDRSNQPYRYGSEKQLQFELLFRREIVAAAEDLYHSDLNFAVFHKARCNEKYWKKTNNGGFLLLQGVQPAEAIRDIYKNGRLYATECATAMVIVYYKALLAVFDESRFNELFRSIYLMNWQLQEPLLKEVGTPKPVSDILLGDRAYFKNPDVSPETLFWQGENVIVCPGALYYGHGVGMQNADTIIRLLNDNRKENPVKSAFLMDSAGRPNFSNLSKLYYKNEIETAAVSAPVLSQAPVPIPKPVPSTGPLTWSLP